LRWSSLPADAIAWREFDGAIVVRNARTGSTHLLERFPAEVLRTMIEADDPMSVPELEARLSLRAAGDEDGAQWSTAIEEVLKDFYRLGLAEPVDR
jgi:PqqD family protein of HPr-rel-A system